MDMWEELSLEDNVSFINEKLIEGLTMKVIEEEYYKVNERTIAKRLLKRGYKRSKEGSKLFILVDEVKSNTEPKKAKLERKKNELQEDYKSSGLQKNSENSELQKNYQSNVDMQKLSELIELIEPIKKLLKKSEFESNVINVDMEELRVVKVEDPKVRSFKISSETLKNWDKFTKDNNVYSVMDLVNSALIEYMNKYSKR